MPRHSTLALFVAFSLSLLAACTEPALVGEGCSDSTDCEVAASCFEHDGAEVTPVCMMDCDLTTTRVCADGSVCTSVTTPDRPANLGVCYLGGTTAIGSSCTRNLECARGSICVDLTPTITTDAEQYCFRACRTDDTAGCAATETCNALEAMGVNGFCQTTVTP